MLKVKVKVLFVNLTKYPKDNRNKKINAEEVKSKKFMKLKQSSLVSKLLRKLKVSGKVIINPILFNNNFFISFLPLI